MSKVDLTHKDAPVAGSGVLPYQALAALMETGAISAATGIEEAQIQPASLDLRLGKKAWRVRASFLPGPGRTVADRVAEFGLHEIDLTDGALLERGCVYIVPLLESLDLPGDLAGVANPKSSTGRLDVFTRMISDGAADFDVAEAGYRGPLYAEIFPRTFSVIVRAGTRLNQLRLTRGDHGVEGAALEKLLREQAVLDRPLSETEARTLSRGVPLSVDLDGIGGADLVGYKARLHAPLIDLDRVNFYDPAEFWEPIYRTPDRAVILDPKTSTSSPRAKRFPCRSITPRRWCPMTPLPGNSAPITRGSSIPVLVTPRRMPPAPARCWKSARMAFPS